MFSNSVVFSRFLIQSDTLQTRCLDPKHFPKHQICPHVITRLRLNVFNAKKVFRNVSRKVFSRETCFIITRLGMCLASKHVYWLGWVVEGLGGMLAFILSGDLNEETYYMFILNLLQFASSLLTSTSNGVTSYLTTPFIKLKRTINRSPI